jgi:glycerol kinase
MEADGATPPRTLRVDGGMVVNDWFLQALADLVGIPVERPEVTETTALGAALLAGLGAGIWSGTEELEGLWRVERRTEPRMAERERDRRHARWREAVERVRTRRDP